MLFYVAGPYRGDVESNIESAKKVAIDLWNAGHTVICPHMNTAHLENHCTLSDEDWLERTASLLQRCDAMMLAPNWSKSEGTKVEIVIAKDVGIPIYEWGTNDIPRLHRTEVERPMQVDAFINTIMQMYRLHLEKNADYSPANILGTGEVGLATRLWDKMARYLNLMGFRIEVAQSSFDAPRDPKFEAIDDTLIDMANYSIIGILLKQNKWGK